MSGNVGAGRGRMMGAALLVVLGLLASACNDGGGERYPTTAFEPDTLTELHKIRDEMASLRGLSPNLAAEEGWMSARDYREYVEGKFGELSGDDFDGVHATDTVLKVLGILQPEESLYEQALDIQSNYIAGFYSFETDQLVLVGGGGKLSKFDKSTFAHEYVHSFQEALTKKNDWEGRFYPDGEDADLPYPSDYDYGQTLGCVQEGDAEFSETMYEGEEVEGWEDQVEYMSWMERNLYFNYSVCVQFVASVFEHGGWEAVNGLYADPPQSIEQVIHPEKFNSREMPSALKAVDLSKELGRGWERNTEDGVFNEFDLWNYILTITGDARLADAAAGGWGMGWINVYTRNDDRDAVVGHVSLRFDTSRDFEEFKSAFDVMLDELGRDGVDEWTNSSGSGHASWDADRNRVDLVVGTDSDRVADAVRALGYPRPESAAKASASLPETK